jgi:Tfp pilus assembly protein PilF
MGGANVSRQAGCGLVLLLLALGATGCASSAPASQAADMKQLQARAAYERGLGHLRDRQPSLALSALQEAIALDGSPPIYWNTLGLLYLQFGRLDDALAQFRKAAELDPEYAEAHLNSGVVLAEAAQWDQAVASYRKAIALPTLATPHIAYGNLGLALYHLKRYGEAEEALRFAVGLDPQLDAAYYHLGLVFSAQNRAEDARAAFRRARDLAPQSPFGQAAGERLKALGEGGEAGRPGRHN